MANIFRMRRSAVSGRVPTTEQLKLGELAINTADGKLFMKKDDGTESIVDITAAAAGGIPEAPLDGNFYVRQNGQWVNLADALTALGVGGAVPIDGGNFETGESTAINNNIADGGNFTDGTSLSTNGDILDGGLITGGSGGGADISDATIDGGEFTP